MNLILQLLNRIKKILIKKLKLKNKINFCKIKHFIYLKKRKHYKKFYNKNHNKSKYKY